MINNSLREDGSNWSVKETIHRQHTHTHTHTHTHYTPGSSLLSLWPCSWSCCSATVACLPSPLHSPVVASFWSVSFLASSVLPSPVVVSKGSGVELFSLEGNSLSLPSAFFGGSVLADFFDLPSSPNNVKNLQWCLFALGPSWHHTHM